MKRFAVLALLATFVFGTVSIASATEFKFSGDMTVNGVWSDNWDFQESSENDDASEETFGINQRMRFNMNFVNSDQLQAWLRLSTGDDFWGEDLPVGGGGSNEPLEVTRAALQFYIPTTEAYITAGLRPVSFANQFGSQILDDDAAAISINTPLMGETLGLEFGYARLDEATGSSGDPDNNEDTTNNGDSTFDEFDLVWLQLPMAFDGVDLTPFVGVGFMGKDALSTGLGGVIGNGVRNPTSATLDDSTLNPFWAGVSLDLSIFDPITFQADFNYGAVEAEAKTGDDFDREGWYFAGKLAYNGLDFLKPALIGHYGSGEDDKTNDSETIPMISNGPSVVAGGSFFFGGSSLRDADIGASPAGTWMIGVTLEDITFIDKLTHTFNVLYVQGTNDKDFVRANGFDAEVLGENDSVFEIDFNHNYKIYDALSLVLELGWITPDFDEDDYTGTTADDLQDAYKAALGLKYKF